MIQTARVSFLKPGEAGSGRRDEAGPNNNFEQALASQAGISMNPSSSAAPASASIAAPFAALVLGALAMGISPVFVRLADVGPFTSAFWRVALAFIKTKSGSALPWIAILAAMAVVSIVITRSVERLLDCTSLITLARSYRTRFFLRIAFAQCVALFGFVFAFIGGPKWVYDAGAAFSLVRFWTGIAPTRSAVADEQRNLEARGCALSLVAALRTTPPNAR